MVTRKSTPSVSRLGSLLLMHRWKDKATEETRAFKLKHLGFLRGIRAIDGFKG